MRQAIQLGLFIDGEQLPPETEFAAQLGVSGAAAKLAAARASALLEQDEAGSGEHPLLRGGQAPAGVSLRQVANHLDDLDQVSRPQLLQVRLVPPRPV